MYIKLKQNTFMNVLFGIADFSSTSCGADIGRKCFFFANQTVLHTIPALHNPYNKRACANFEEDTVRTLYGTGGAVPAHPPLHQMKRKA